MASASGSGPNPAAPPALSDEQAEQFAASFTPSWDTDGDPDSHDADAPNGATNATLVDAPAVNAAQAASIVQGVPGVPTAPAHGGLSKQTLIGTAPQANAPVTTAAAAPVRAAASSAEAIDPENILDSSTAPSPPVKAAPATLKGTQPLQGAQPAPQQAKAHSRPPPAPAAAARNARVAVNADPFAVSSGPRARGAASARAGQQSDDLDDFVPKKSSKTLYAVIGGLAIAAGLGLFLKFALTDDAPKPVEQHATGPAVTTADIPPPPPKVDTPPPTPTTGATAAATTATAAKVEPPPATLPAPQAARAPDPPSAATHAAAPPPPPRSEPRPRTPPPPPAAAAPPPPATPKTPPKPANGSIVRDNPF